MPRGLFSQQVGWNENDLVAHAAFGSKTSNLHQGAHGTRLVMSKSLGWWARIRWMRVT